eukprot:gb/GECG01011253.1/.p1 GENE.gb/GECG01011253.1/~~gb/GECG01011253.1/.p1  ORF type:complete len:671 (+),score=104.91 gb/GECG01011253.1/:1-2013(+)
MATVEQSSAALAEHISSSQVDATSSTAQITSSLEQKNPHQLPSEDIEELYGALGSAMDSAAILQRSAASTFSTTARSVDPQNSEWKRKLASESVRSGSSAAPTAQAPAARNTTTYYDSRAIGRTTGGRKFTQFVSKTRRMRRDLRESIPTVGFTEQMGASTEDPAKLWNQRVGKTDSRRPVEISGIQSNPEMRYLPTPPVSPHTKYENKTVYVAKPKSTPRKPVKQDYTSDRDQPRSLSEETTKYRQQPTPYWSSPVVFQGPTPSHEYVNFPTSTVVNPPSVNVNPPPVHVHVNNNYAHETGETKTDNSDTYYQQQIYELRRAIDDLNRKSEELYHRLLESKTSDYRGPSDEQILSLVTSLALQESRGYERPQQQPVTVNVHSPEQKQEEHSDKESVAEHAIQMLSNISAQFENSQNRWAELLSGRLDREDKLFDEFQALRQAMDDARNRPQEEASQDNSLPFGEILEQINRMVDRFSSTLSDAYQGQMGNLAEQFGKIREDMLNFARESQGDAEPEPFHRQITVSRCATVHHHVPSEHTEARSEPQRTTQQPPQESFSTSSTSEESGMDIATYINMLRRSHQSLYSEEDELLVDERDAYEPESSPQRGHQQWAEDTSADRLGINDESRGGIAAVGDVGERPSRNIPEDSDSLSTSTFPLSEEESNDVSY